MASIYQEIRSVLEHRLSTTAGIPDIAWENVSFEPTTGTAFVKPMFQPTSRRPAVRGLNPQHRIQGIFTILCYYPENAGPGASQSLVDSLVDRFASTSDISLSGTTVSLEYTEQNPSYLDSPWYITPITVAWYIYS